MKGWGSVRDFSHSFSKLTTRTNLRPKVPCRPTSVSYGWRVKGRRSPESEETVKDRVLAAIRSAMKCDGPVRLVASRTLDDLALFEADKGPEGRAIKRCLDGSNALLECEARKHKNQPRFVTVTDKGLDFILVNTASTRRPNLISSADSIYQERLIERWMSLMERVTQDWLRDFTRLAGCLPEQGKLTRKLYQVYQDVSPDAVFRDKSKNRTVRQ